MAKWRDIGRKFWEMAARRYKTTALFCGLLAVAALPPFYYFWCLFPAFCGVAWLGCKQEKKLALAAIGYWFGFGFFAAGFYWIGNALLVDIERTGWLYPFVLLLNGAFFGLFTILPMLAMKLSKRPWVKILLLAVVWGVVSEWLRGWILTGFPWNPLSSALSFNPVWLQTLVWWGTYGLSTVLLLVVTLPVLWLQAPLWKNVWAPILSLLLLLGLWGYGSYVLAQATEQTDGEKVRVRLVQPSIPQSLKWNQNAADKNFAEYIALSRQDGFQAVDFVVWGETASPFDLVNDWEHRFWAREAVPPQGYLLAGFLGYDKTVAGEDYALYNSLLAMDENGEVLGIYSKNHLVPFGEYIPFRKYLPSWVRPMTNMVAEFGRGEKYQTIKLDGYPEFAPLICYEIIFSGQIVRKQNKPKWAVVLTNDGWYGKSAGPYQHLAAAQMRAVEEGIYVVRSANSGISAVIDPYGRIIAQLGLGERGVVDADIYL